MTDPSLSVHLPSYPSFFLPFPFLINAADAGSYSRIFPHLPPWRPQGRTDTERLTALKQLADTMLELPNESDDIALDNPTIPAGYTVFAQFIAHDLTFDSLSSFSQLDSSQTYPLRTPQLLLHGIYRNGPLCSPHLYDQNQQNQDGFTGFFFIGTGDHAAEDDLPRNRQGRALIGDPRNDEHILLAQLHLALLKFHNEVLAAVHASGLSGIEAFTAAQRIVRWHYQWVIIHDFLPRLIGPALADRMLERATFLTRKTLVCHRGQHDASLPLEFLAVLCALQSMIRSSYILSDTLEEIRHHIDIGGAIPIFLPPHQHSGPLADLRGQRQLPRFWTVQWDRFLEFSNHRSQPASVQMSRQFNTKLAFRLGNLDSRSAPPYSVPYLNLWRSCCLGLPSGQSISYARGLDPSYRPEGDDPLWFYILQEAALGGGQRLGTIGGMLLAEVLLGILTTHPHSFLNVDPTWTPQKERVIRLASSNDELFQLRDILNFAKVPITRDDIEAKVRWF